MVTIIIPAYNCEKYICQAVHSVQTQSLKELEILLLDDCSTDGTLQLLKELAIGDGRVQIIANPQNRGVANTRNKGLDLAKGDFIAFLDGDDVWLSDKLEKQLTAIKRNDLDLCYTAYSFIDAEGRNTCGNYHVPETLSYKKLLQENVIGCSTAVFRAAYAKSIHMRGEYAHEDYVFWLELLQNGCKAGGIDEPLMCYRVHKQSRSGDKKKAAGGRWRVYRDFLKLPFLKAAALFSIYTVQGIRKRVLYFRGKKST